MEKQECIPVGCVPPAAVVIPGGLHQAPPGADPQSRPPQEQAPPWEQAPQSRYQLGAGTPLGADPPWRSAAMHAGIPPAMHAGIAPPVDRILDTCL